MNEDHLTFFFGFFIWLGLFSIISVMIFHLFYSWFIVVMCLKEKWFRRTMPIAILANTFYLVILNVIFNVETFNVKHGHDLLVFYGVGATALTLIGSLVRIKAFVDKRLILFLLAVELAALYVPFDHLFWAAMGI